MPQPFNNAVITKEGARLLTRAQAGEIRVQFTRLVVGDGTYTAEEKDILYVQKQTGLRSLKNSYALSDIEVYNDHSVKVTALITNKDPVTGLALVEEGYYINEIGLYARAVDGEDIENEVLYSIAVTAAGSGDFMPPYNGYNPAQIIQDYYCTVSNASEVTIQTGNPAVALAEDVEELRKQIIELNVYSNTVYQQATGYTDQKIADLINGAPGTLDTLGEIARAMQDNEEVVLALDAAIGKKANAVEVDSHVKDTTIHITAEERTKWSGKANSSHDHDSRYYTETEIDSKLNGKANNVHNHDDRYYTESEVDIKLGDLPDYFLVSEEPITGNVRKHYIRLQRSDKEEGGSVEIPYNTWRGIQDNLSSTSTTESLSANQGRILNNTKMHVTTDAFTDYNNLGTGIFFGPGGTVRNQPVDDFRGIIISVNAGNWLIHQVCFDIWNGGLYERFYKSDDGGWHAWRKYDLAS